MRKLLATARITVQRLQRREIEEISRIGAENFSIKDKKTVERWIRCNMRAASRMQYFTIKVNNHITGYILWTEHGGFRKHATFELEQIAIKKSYQDKGLGTILIKKSRSAVVKYLKRRGANLQTVFVTTGEGSEARNLYERTLSVKLECVIESFYGNKDEAFLAWHAENQLV